MEFAKAMPGAIRETNSASGAPLRPVRLGAPVAVLDKRADGCLCRSFRALQLPLLRQTDRGRSGI